MGAAPIYHICGREEWQAVQSAGCYQGSSQDAADGFLRRQFPAKDPPHSRSLRRGLFWLKSHLSAQNSRFRLGNIHYL